MQKKIVILFFLLWSASLIKAAIRIEASAPSVVGVGEQFRLEYTVNSQSIKSIQTISKIQGFNILYGPSRSTYNSVQSINGTVTSSSSTTYGYTLVATHPGNYVMPRISANVGGQTVVSNVVRIRVLSTGNAGGGRGGQSAASASNVPVNSSEKSGKISGKDLFITVTANKNNVYEQEPILLTYRVYARVNLTQLAGKMPDLKGFMTKEVTLPQQKSFSIASYNGQNYYTTVWSQYVMFPQQTGKLIIPSIRFDGIVEFQNPDIDPIDAFFNGNSGSFQRKKSIIAPPLTINVRPLPSKPTNFSGAVGQFTIQSFLKTPHPRENETIDLQLVIKGTGNVELIKAPDVRFPRDFETYDPKQTSDSKLTTHGMNGSMVIDYIAVPHHKGRYTIPSIDFVYFDTSIGTYRTLRTAPMTIDVAKGERNIYSAEQAQQLANSDIRYIYKGKIKLYHPSDLLWNRPLYWMIYAIVFLLFCAAYVILDRHTALRADVAGRKVRGAGRLSRRRLRRANQLLRLQKTDEFYEEILSALMGYVSDRLNIPVSELTHERILQEFQQAGVEKQTSDAFLSLLDRCESYHYSLYKDEVDTTSFVYDQTADMLNSLEKTLKKKKK